MPKLGENVPEEVVPDNVPEVEPRKPPNPGEPSPIPGTIPRQSSNEGEPTIPPPEVDFVPSQEEHVSKPIHYRRPRATHKTENLEGYRKYLAYLPLQVVTETFKRTTQLAKSMFSYPLV